MTTAAATPPGRRRFAWRDGLGYALVAGAVWLGWEVVKAPLASRAAPALAVRVAPASPEVLRRAAESELLAERHENARDLAAESLARGPFNARALRVRGLAEARLGSVDRADEMLTLAGNWSLRDDPAHAWLIENRLRRGDYGSAFAHADTLARRRPDMYPAIFRLFTTAAARDPRAFPVVTRLMAANPPWRAAYIDHLLRDPAGPPIIGGLAIALQGTAAPFDTTELQQVYDRWLAEHRYAGVRQLRARLQPASSDPYLQNGNFSTDVDEQLQPFGWALGVGPGISASVVEDDLRPGNMAFRLNYDGFATGVLNRQLLVLAPGSYVLAGRWRAETPQAEMPFEWEVVCAESGTRAALRQARLGADSANWRPFTASFTIPRENCSAQWLQLAAIPGDRRTTIAAWFDDLRIRPSADARTTDPSSGRRSADSTTVR